MLGISAAVGLALLMTITASAAAALTPGRLAAELATGVKTERVPSNLNPSLAAAGRSRPIVAENGCNLGHAGTRSRPCVYGDTRSHTTVVLFGDSHAAAWFPALDLISRHQHWRLAVFTKDGCPPAEVNIAAWFRNGGAYRECTRWRANAKAQIAALHPLLVITTTSTYLEEPEARAEPGVPRRYGSPWANGMAAIFSFLHRVARHALFLSDAPTLTEWAPSCVAQHPSNVRACTTRRSAALLLGGVRATEIRLAHQAGVDAIDPTSWFCTPTRCPVIVGNILLYRDNSHMTPAWSRFIAPVLSASVLAIVQGTQASPGVKRP